MSNTTKYDPNNREDRVALADALRSMLETAGFEPVDQDGPAKEAIYGRPHTEIDHVRVTVYSSIVGDKVRGIGEDAIRVVALYKTSTGQVRPVGKADARVFRVGEIADIVNRCLARMREVWADCRTGEFCRHCGAPLAWSGRTKRMYCPEGDVCHQSREGK